MIGKSQGSMPMRALRALVAVGLLGVVLLFAAGCASVDQYDPKPWDPDEGKDSGPGIGIPI